MKLDKETQLFFGCRIDSRLREGLALAKPGDRKYFEDPEAGFLRIVSVPKADNEKRAERWIGKAVKGGLNCAEVEDIQRNVVSILRRIIPEVRVNPSTVKIFVVDDSEPDTGVDLGDGDDDGEDGNGDQSAADRSGPYIEY